MKKIILLFAILIGNIPSSLVVAQDEFQLKDLETITIEPAELRDTTLGEKQKYLFKNELAPFEGLLLNPEAAAIIVSEYENYKLRAGLALDTQKKSDLLKLNLETKKLRLELETQKKKSDIEIKGRDKELKSCHKINKKIIEDRNHIKGKIFLGLGTGAAGVVIGLLVGILAI